jgi:hypothetical protein
MILVDLNPDSTYLLKATNRHKVPYSSIVKFTLHAARIHHEVGTLPRIM